MFTSEKKNFNRPFEQENSWNSWAVNKTVGKNLFSIARKKRKSMKNEHFWVAWFFFAACKQLSSKKSNIFFGTLLFFGVAWVGFCISEKCSFKFCEILDTSQDISLVRFKCDDRLKRFSSCDVIISKIFSECQLIHFLSFLFAIINSFSNNFARILLLLLLFLMLYMWYSALLWETCYSPRSYAAFFFY